MPVVVLPPPRRLVLLRVEVPILEKLARRLLGRTVRVVPQEEVERIDPPSGKRNIMAARAREIYGCWSLFPDLALRARAQRLPEPEVGLKVVAREEKFVDR